MLGALLVAYYELVDHLWRSSLWWEIAWLDLVLIPAVFLLVWLVLPLWNQTRLLLPLALACAGVAVIAQHQHWHLLANFAKLAAYTCAGWAFLRLFEMLSWGVAIAAIIPFVDAVSVFLPKGPTHEIVNNHPQVYSAVAVAFVAPGGGAAGLGPPDILFFALFLAATVRWRLRPGWTWLAMTGMYSLTLVLANATDVNGLPALPFLSAGFLLANGDLLWRRLRPRTA